MDIIERLRRFLGIPPEDTDQIAILVDIVDLAEQHLKAKLRKDVIPEQLRYILFEVSVIRYNRMGSEGMKSETIEGHSVNYVDDDFKPYESVIADYREESIGGWQFGDVTFL